MKNKKAWEDYKAKCEEKGLSLNYESAEEFSKAMTVPPKPFSTDDFAPKRNAKQLLKSEPNAKLLSNDFCVKRRGRPKKTKPVFIDLNEETTPLRLKEGA